jgi:tRNA U38,U39,U40 pseudouridine synthase TruA
MTLEDMKRLFEEKKRPAHNRGTAPPNGLFLAAIFDDDQEASVLIDEEQSMPV